MFDIGTTLLANTAAAAGTLVGRPSGAAVAAFILLTVPMLPERIAGAALPAAIASSTSLRTIRPAGPDPCTRVTSNPASSAIFLASGLMNTRPLPSRRPSACAGASSTAVALLPVAALPAAAPFAAAAFATGAAAPPLPALAFTAATSSPAAASTIITVPTATTCPCGTVIAATTPSSNDCNSMVALSVSISAMTSPLLIF